MKTKPEEEGMFLASSFPLRFLRRRYTPPEAASPAPEFRLHLWREMGDKTELETVFRETFPIAKTKLKKKTRPKANTTQSAHSYRALCPPARCAWLWERGEAEPVVDALRCAHVDCL